MRRLIPALLLAASLMGGAAWAQDEDSGKDASTPKDSQSADEGGTVAEGDEYVFDENQQGVDENLSENVPEDADHSQQQAGTAGETTAEAQEVTSGYLSNELVGIKPQVGMVGFRDPFQNENVARAALGFTLDMNIARAATDDPAYSRVFVGPSTGFIYSHLGDPTSSFFGTSADAPVGNAGSNMFQIPVNLKLGYTFGDRFRLAGHGGGNVIFRSLASSIDIGGTGATDVWTFYPNAGLDLEYGLAKNVALMLRPDWTFIPNGDGIFTATLALAFPLG
jgi:hypothetical protein